MAETRVLILMGSESDLPRMQEAAEVLAGFGVGAEVAVASAHRAPGLVRDLVAGAGERGIGVIIAGAGMAAHLPGVVASLSPLPVIGVPLRSGALDGLDALYSIVQMPPGVPVATVAIDGARNAGYLAAQILSLQDPALREKFREHKRKLEQKAQETYAKNRAGG